MTGPDLLRGAAGLAGAVLGARASGAIGRGSAAVLLGVAALGVFPVPWPGPPAAGSCALVFSLLFAAGAALSVPVVASEALAAFVPFALAPAALAAVLVSGEGPVCAGLAATTALLSVSLLVASASAANAEAGWRKLALIGAGVVLASAGPSAVAAMRLTLGPGRRPYVVAGALAAALLPWGILVSLESRRVHRELSEEVSLGLLPGGDPAILASPWRRSREGRFGRRDERREYVRSALFLAVARGQQRRRSGEAERLRQLEILAFRTRLKRAVDARREREEREAAAPLEVG